MDITPYEQRAKRWALQTSTIIGAATIVAAAIGGTVDATTGLPVVSALVGLVAGGVAAIFLPGQDAAPIVAGAEAIVSAAASHASNAEKAATAASTAGAVVATEAPKIAEHAESIATSVQQLEPIAAAIAEANGQSAVGKAIAEAGPVLGAVTSALEPKPAT